LLVRSLSGGDQVILRACRWQPRGGPGYVVARQHVWRNQREHYAPQQSTRQCAMPTALVVSGSFGPSRLSAGRSG